MFIFGNRPSVPFAIVYADDYKKCSKNITWPDDIEIIAINCEDLILLSFKSGHSLLPIPPKRLQNLNYLKMSNALLALKPFIQAIPVSITLIQNDISVLVQKICDYSNILKNHLQFAGQAIDYQIKIKTKKTCINEENILHSSIFEHAKQLLEKHAIGLLPVFKEQDPKLIMNAYAAIKIGEEASLFNALETLDSNFQKDLYISIRGPEPGWSLGILTNLENNINNLWITPFIPGQENSMPGIALQKKIDTPVQKNNKEVAA